MQTPGCRNLSATYLLCVAAAGAVEARFLLVQLLGGLVFRLVVGSHAWRGCISSEYREWKTDRWHCRCCSSPSGCWPMRTTKPKCWRCRRIRLAVHCGLVSSRRAVGGRLCRHRRTVRILRGLRRGRGGGGAIGRRIRSILRHSGSRNGRGAKHQRGHANLGQTFHMFLQRNPKVPDSEPTSGTRTDETCDFSERNRVGLMAPCATFAMIA